MSLLSPTIMQQLCQAAILGYLDCIRIRGNHLMVLYDMCKKKFPNINTLMLGQLDANRQYYPLTDDLVWIENVNVRISQA